MSERVAFNAIIASPYGTFWSAIIRDTAGPDEPPRISVDLVEEKEPPSSTGDPPSSDEPEASAATSAATLTQASPARNRASSLVVRPSRPAAVQRSTTDV